MAHFDFVIYDKVSLKPICAVEYDGLYHREDKRTIENDYKKDSICNLVGFKLIRISSKEQEQGWKKFKEYFELI